MADAHGPICRCGARKDNEKHAVCMGCYRAADRVLKHHCKSDDVNVRRSAFRELFSLADSRKRARENPILL